MKLVRLGRPRGRLDLLLGRVGTAVGDVGGDRVAEQEALFEDDADPGPQRGHRRLADVDAVDLHGAALHVVEARQQQRDRRLARSGAADQRDASPPARRPATSPRQHRLGNGVAERHVVELDTSGSGGHRRGVRGVDDLGGRVDDLEDPLDAGPGLLADGEQRGQHPDRADQLRDVGGEGQEGAEA